MSKVGTRFEITASSYQDAKLVLAGDRSECCVVTKLIFIEFQGWIELFSAGNLHSL